MEFVFEKLSNSTSRGKSYKQEAKINQDKAMRQTEKWFDLLSVAIKNNSEKMFKSTRING